jgi:hypothetical protein
VFRRTAITTTAVMLVLAGSVLTAVPAQAAAATPRLVHLAAPTVLPCPLTGAELAAGRQIVARAMRTLDDAVRVGIGSGGKPPTVVPVENPASWGEAWDLCMLAMNDLKHKIGELEVAVRRYLQCKADAMNTGADCSNAQGNAEAAFHDVEVASDNLSNACPWLDLPLI